MAISGVAGQLQTIEKVDRVGSDGALAGDVRYAWTSADGGVRVFASSLKFSHLSAEPAFNEDGTIAGLLDGEIYELKRHKALLQSKGHVFQSESAAEVLVHGYEQGGADFFHEVEGIFTAVLWDANQTRLVVVNDQFGMRPVYYRKIAGALLFASSLRKLIDASIGRVQLSRDGLAQFFTFGHFWGNTTLFEDIWVLPATAWASYQLLDDVWTVEQYKKWEIPSSQQRTTGEWLDDLDSAFVDAVRRRTDDSANLGLSLSGGLDARTILGVIDHAKTPIKTVCLGMRGSIDQQVSAKLAAATNRKHYQHVLDDLFLRDFEKHLRHMVELTDGQYLCQCIVMPTLPVYRDLGIEVLLRGHAGELLHFNKAYNFSVDREFFTLRDDAQLENWLWTRLQAYMTDGAGSGLFEKSLQDELKARARAALVEGMVESAGARPEQRLAHLFLTQRLRRETAMSLREFGSVVEVRLPYLDSAFVDLALAMPASMKLGDKVQAHILSRHRPEFLKITNANTGAPLGANVFHEFLTKWGMKVLSKLGVSGYQPYERLGLWLRRELRPLAEKLLLHERFAERGVFQPEGVRRVLRQHMRNERNHTYLILALMIFETGQRLLVDREVV